MANNFNPIFAYGKKGNPITLIKLKEFLKDKKANKQNFENFVYDRLFERYIEPFEEAVQRYDCNSEIKLGFAIMANMCLLIEALQSFRLGDGYSKMKTSDVFKNFFDANKLFENLDTISFYENVRCGILHEGEIRAGWTISPNAPMEKKHINPKEFLKAMKDELNNYKTQLHNEDVASNTWESYFQKIEHICQSA